MSAETHEALERLGCMIETQPFADCSCPKHAHIQEQKADLAFVAAELARMEEALREIADGSWGRHAPPFYDVREFALSRVSATPEKQT